MTISDDPEEKLVVERYVYSLGAPSPVTEDNVRDYCKVFITSQAGKRFFLNFCFCYCKAIPESTVYPEVLSQLLSYIPDNDAEECQREVILAKWWDHMTDGLQGIYHESRTKLDKKITI